MKRTTLTASLVGSAAAGLLAAAIATPAWAQATTYPEGTDCSAIQNSASRTDCMNQMNESRQNQVPGGTEVPSANAPTDVAPGAAQEAPNGGQQNNNAPDNSTVGGGNSGGGGGNGSGTSGSGGGDGGGATQ